MNIPRWLLTAQQRKQLREQEMRHIAERAAQAYIHRLEREYVARTGQLPERLRPR